MNFRNNRDTQYPLFNPSSAIEFHGEDLSSFKKYIFKLLIVKYEQDLFIILSI